MDTTEFKQKVSQASETRTLQFAEAMQQISLTKSMVNDREAATLNEVLGLNGHAKRLAGDFALIQGAILELSQQGFTSNEELAEFILGEETDNGFKPHNGAVAVLSFFLSESQVEKERFTFYEIKYLVLRRLLKSDLTLSQVRKASELDLKYQDTDQLNELFS